MKGTFSNNRSVSVDVNKYIHPKIKAIFVKMIETNDSSPNPCTNHFVPGQSKKPETQLDEEIAIGHAYSFGEKFKDSLIVAVKVEFGRERKLFQVKVKVQQRRKAVKEMQEKFAKLQSLGRSPDMPKGIIPALMVLYREITKMRGLG